MLDIGGHRSTAGHHQQVREGQRRHEALCNERQLWVHDCDVVPGVLCVRQTKAPGLAATQHCGRSRVDAGGVL